MNKIIAVFLTLMLTACAATQNAQQTYVQACSAYSAAFSAAFHMRVVGNLSIEQINQITLIDEQITPICTGALPPDPVAATQQVTAAVTTLTILQVVKASTK